MRRPAKYSACNGYPQKLRRRRAGGPDRRRRPRRRAGGSAGRRSRRAGARSTESGPAGGCRTGPRRGPRPRGVSCAAAAAGRSGSDRARQGALHVTTCSACHGADLRGGGMGGPNLLRSQVVLMRSEGRADSSDRARRTRRSGACRAMPLQDDDVLAVAEYIHSVLGRSRGIRGRRRRPRRRRPTRSSATPAAGQRSTSRPSAARATRQPATCRASPPSSPTARRCRTAGSPAPDNRRGGRGGRGAAPAPGEPVHRRHDAITATVTLPVRRKARGPDRPDGQLPASPCGCPTAASGRSARRRSSRRSS